MQQLQQLALWSLPNAWLKKDIHNVYEEVLFVANLSLYFFKVCCWSQNTFLCAFDFTKSWKRKGYVWNFLKVKVCIKCITFLLMWVKDEIISNTYLIPNYEYIYEIEVFFLDVFCFNLNQMNICWLNVGMQQPITPQVWLRHRNFYGKTWQKLTKFW